MWAVQSSYVFFSVLRLVRDFMQEFILSLEAYIVHQDTYSDIVEALN